MCQSYSKPKVGRFWRHGVVKVFTARRHASMVYAVVVCLSVTSQCSSETAKYRITETTPHISPGTLVS